MAGYRFCRSDDVPLLVEAYDTCYRVHFSELPPLSVAGFKRAVREIDLWASSCMLAIEDRKPIAVMLAAKRASENCILAIGVRPDRLRLGHAGHMLESLARKLAILGPPRIVTELPMHLSGVRSLFEKLEYRHERHFVDWTAPPVGVSAPVPEALMPIAFADLDDIEVTVVDPAASTCWVRAPETRSNLADELRGFAVGAGDRIEAYVLWRDLEEPRRREISAIHCTDAAPREPMMRLLISACRATAEDRAVRICRVAEDEIPGAWLEVWGFRAGDAFDRFSVDAEAYRMQDLSR